jgi:glutathione reductase (NADPH)
MPKQGGTNSMTAEQFGVVILRGGNAGIGVTGPVRRAGMSVAMMEAGDLGGTCPNRGCTPKKILVAAGHALHDIERAGIHKISVGKPTQIASSTAPAVSPTWIR